MFDRILHDILFSSTNFDIIRHKNNFFDHILFYSTLFYHILITSIASISFSRNCRQIVPNIVKIAKFFLKNCFPDFLYKFLVKIFRFPKKRLLQPPPIFTLKNCERENFFLKKKLKSIENQRNHVVITKLLKTSMKN